MKSKTSSKKKTSPVRGKTKAAARPASRKAVAKAPAARPAASADPKVASYTPKPIETIEGIGWAPFRYSR
jgi:predicted flap endonuclease-1-like 5' DNA nuclease